MALTVCPDCESKVSDKALSCPSCGFPLQPPKIANAWGGVLGGVAGTYISAQALVTIVIGSVMFAAFAAIMIVAILS
jgi:hypothetical protein